MKIPNSKQKSTDSISKVGPGKVFSKEKIKKKMSQVVIPVPKGPGVKDRTAKEHKDLKPKFIQRMLSEKTYAVNQSSLFNLGIKKNLEPKYLGMISSPEYYESLAAGQLSKEQMEAFLDYLVQSDDGSKNKGPAPSA